MHPPHSEEKRSRQNVRDSVSEIDLNTVIPDTRTPVLTPQVPPLNPNNSTVHQSVEEKHLQQPVHEISLEASASLTDDEYQLLQIGAGNQIRIDKNNIGPSFENSGTGFSQALSAVIQKKELDLKPLDEKSLSNVVSESPAHTIFGKDFCIQNNCTLHFFIVSQAFGDCLHQIMDSSTTEGRNPTAEEANYFELANLNSIHLIYCKKRYFPIFSLTLAEDLKDSSIRKSMPQLYLDPTTSRVTRLIINQKTEIQGLITWGNKKTQRNGKFFPLRIYKDTSAYTLQGEIIAGTSALITAVVQVFAYPINEGLTFSYELDISIPDKKIPPFPVIIINSDNQISTAIDLFRKGIAFKPRGDIEKNNIFMRAIILMAKALSWLMLGSLIVGGTFNLPWVYLKSVKFEENDKWTIKIFKSILIILNLISIPVSKPLADLWFLFSNSINSINLFSLSLGILTTRLLQKRVLLPNERLYDLVEKKLEGVDEPIEILEENSTNNQNDLEKRVEKKRSCASNCCCNCKDINNYNPRNIAAEGLVRALFPLTSTEIILASFIPFSNPVFNLSIVPQFKHVNDNYILLSNYFVSYVVCVAAIQGANWLSQRADALHATFFHYNYVKQKVTPGIPGSQRVSAGSQRSSARLPHVPLRVWNKNSSAREVKNDNKRDSISGALSSKQVAALKLN